MKMIGTVYHYSYVCHLRQGCEAAVAADGHPILWQGGGLIHHSLVHKIVYDECKEPSQPEHRPRCTQIFWSRNLLINLFST